MKPAQDLLLRKFRFLWNLGFIFCADATIDLKIPKGVLEPAVRVPGAYVKSNHYNVSRDLHKLMFHYLR